MNILAGVEKDLVVTVVVVTFVLVLVVAALEGSASGTSCKRYEEPADVTHTRAST
jgi:hypothetical protein